MADDTADLIETDSDAAGTEPVAPAEDAPADGQYGVGPFTVREVAIIGTWLIGFVVSFFSLALVRFDSVWTSGLMWILTIGVPTVAVFLLVLRRLSPEGIRRVGSLGIDQFASVAFSVSAMVWVQMMWETVAFAMSGGPFVRSWVMWVELVVMLILVVLTVFAPLIPVLREDFEGRPEAGAHRNARPVRAVISRPAPAAVPVTEEPAHAAPAEDATAPVAQSPEDEQAEAASQPATAPVGPFWALAPVERDVHDEQGEPLFTVGPTAWALVIEDRGEVYVIQHEDGRVGYLHDVTGVTRG